MSFVSKVKSSGTLVYLVKGKDLGLEAWHYVLVKNKVVLPIFLKNVSSGSLDVSKYGEILFSGWGVHPPEEIVNKIIARYG